MIMKKYFVIITISLLTGFAGLAQEDDNEDDRGGKLQVRMREYIQKRLNLSRNEAEKFSPIFLRYILELRRTHREHKTDKPLLQLRVAEVRVRFRNEFRQIMDEQRANRVFEHQREFEKMIKDEIIQRRTGNGPIRRNRALQLH